MYNDHKEEKVDLESMELLSQAMVSNYYGEIALYCFHDNYFLTLENWDHDRGRQVSKDFADSFMREFGSLK